MKKRVNNFLTTNTYIKYIIIGVVCGFLISFSSEETNDIKHIIHMGQSLGAGEESLPIVTDTATGYGNIMFKIGTHTWTKKYHEGKPWLRDSSLFSFIPLTAKERGHEGETIGNGLCDHLKSTATRFMNPSSKFLFSYTGQGGRLIRELDKRHDDAKDSRAGSRKSEGGYYNTILDDVKRAKKSSELLKKKYSVMAITWMQGESNRFGSINRWDKPIEDKKEYMDIYLEDLIQLKNDLQTDIVEITKQSSNIPFFTYQSAGTTIGTAQLMACDKERDMYMVGATYMLPNAENSRMWAAQKHGDGIHLAADGQRWLGEMFAKVIRKVIFEKEDWDPLRPLGAILSNDRKNMYVNFHVPSPPIVLDTLLLPKQSKSFGFQIYNGSNFNEINSVSVFNDSTIKITLVNPIPPAQEYYLSYGLQSYVNEISKPIHKISKSFLIKNVSYIELEFEGDIFKEFDIIAQEGAFIMGNRYTNSKDLTSVIVRKVYLNKKGNTVLLAEEADLRSNVPFKLAQRCFIARVYSYGNLRDSDTEKSTYTFKDKMYGSRYGMQYPLFNWSIVFDDMLIETKSMKHQ
jgi:hypothetical protein